MNLLIRDYSALLSCREHHRGQYVVGHLYKEAAISCQLLYAAVLISQMPVYPFGQPNTQPSAA